VGLACLFAWQGKTKLLSLGTSQKTTAAETTWLVWVCDGEIRDVGGVLQALCPMKNCCHLHSIKIGKFWREWEIAGWG